MKINALFVQTFAIMSLVLNSNSMAQISPVDKGSAIISGDFSYSSSGGELYENNDGERITRIDFDPAVSFFVVPGFAAGLRLQYRHQIQGDHTTTTWGVGPEINYFFHNSEEISEAAGETYPFLQAAFFYSTMSFDSYSGEVVTRIYTTTHLGAGIAHMISNAVAISGLLAYDIENFKQEDAFDPRLMADDSISGDRIGLYVGLLIFLY